MKIEQIDYPFLSDLTWNYTFIGVNQHVRVDCQLDASLYLYGVKGFSFEKLSYQQAFPISANSTQTLFTMFSSYFLDESSSMLDTASVNMTDVSSLLQYARSFDFESFANKSKILIEHYKSKFVENSKHLPSLHYDPINGDYFLPLEYSGIHEYIMNSTLPSMMNHLILDIPNICYNLGANGNENSEYWKICLKEFSLDLLTQDTLQTKVEITCMDPSTDSVCNILQPYQNMLQTYSDSNQINMTAFSVNNTFFQYLIGTSSESIFSYYEVSSSNMATLLATRSLHIEKPKKKQHKHLHIKDHIKTKQSIVSSIFFGNNSNEFPEPPFPYGNNSYNNISDPYYSDQGYYYYSGEEPFPENTKSCYQWNNIIFTKTNFLLCQGSNGFDFALVNPYFTVS